MKRTEIISKLLKEGFSEKTLMNFTDKQLGVLSNRIDESVSPVTASVTKMKENPKFAMDVENISKSTGKPVELVPENKDAMPGLKAKKEVKEGGVPGLNAKKSSGELSHGTTKKEVKEGGVPGLNAKKSSGELSHGTTKKEVKEGGVPGLSKPKVVKETGVPGLNAKKSSGELSHGTTKKEVKEAEGAMPGLTVKSGKKSVEEEKPSVGTTKNKKTETNGKEVEDKKTNGKNDKRAAFIEMLKKKKNKENVNEWVENVAKKTYHPFTTKNDIMEMIFNKMEEVGEEVEVPRKVGGKLPGFLTSRAIKSAGADAPAPAKPKTRPTTEPGTTPRKSPNWDPFRKPDPGLNPRPKAGVGQKSVNEISQNLIDKSAIVAQHKADSGDSFTRSLKNRQVTRFSSAISKSLQDSAESIGLKIKGKFEDTYHILYQEPDYSMIFTVLIKPKETKLISTHLIKGNEKVQIGLGDIKENVLRKVKRLVSIIGDEIKNRDF